MQKSILLTFIPILGVILLVLGGCKIDPAKPVDLGNEWPRVYLVNVPPDSSHLPHAPVVYWYGADPDGYIIAYHWAIDDTSTWNVLDVDSFLGTQDTIAFSAPLPDTEFTHVFYVRAMDNQREVTIQDSIPRRVFHVHNIPPVNTVIDEGPDDSSTAFVIPDTIATWSGVHFEWSTEDSDQVFPPQFSWKWDNGPWSAWDEAAEKDFSGNDDPALLTEGFHTLYLKAMDDAMAIDSSCIPRTIEVYFPTFAKDLLVIDETRNMSGLRGQPTDAEADDFYKLVLDNAGWGGRYDTVDNSNELGTIPHKTIGEYKIVLLHSDDPLPSRINEAYILQEYLDVGGRLFIGGFQVLSKLNEKISITDYLGVESYTVNGASDFIGAFPESAWYSYLEVDTTKLLEAWNGAIKEVGIYQPRNVFNALYSYDSKSDSADFEGQTAVIFRFDYDEDDDITFKAAVASFQLYAVDVDPVSGEPLATTMRNILDYLER